MSRVTDHGSPVTPSALWTIVPVRGIAGGKSRLAGVLDSTARARLNRRLLEHTLRAVSEWRGNLDQCMVVSACDETLAVAANLGAAVLPEGAEARGLNAAAARGREYARAHGAARTLVLASDLPRLTADALAGMAAGSSDVEMVLAPDRHGTGTNALIVNARRPFHFQFGPGSCEKHLAAAEERGWRTVLFRLPELEFDLDTPEDLATCGSSETLLEPQMNTDEHS